MSALEGGCFCGAVRYRLRAAPMFVHCCHCRDCQLQTGGAFAINALIETSNVELIAGEPRPIAMKTQSGYPHQIFRCPSCQSAVWSAYGMPGVSFIRVATLDAPGALTPDVHIYTRSKLPWMRLPEGARAFEAYYDMNAEWPPDSTARREALKEKV